MAGIQLTTLGRTELTRTDGGSILSVLAQPKRLALLVYLVVEGSDRLVRRDSVATVFWPDSDQSDARANLRKSLYYLKQSLGPDVLVTRGDEEVGIDPALLECDVVILLSGGPVEAEGPFLDGFHFTGASVEWEDWLGAVRERVRSHAPAQEAGEPADGVVPQRHEEGDGSAGDPVEGTGPMRPFRHFVPTLVVLVLAGFAWLGLRDEADRPTRYDRVRLGSGAQFLTVVQRHYALPPDGSGILFRDSVDRRQGTWWKGQGEIGPTYVDGLDDIFGPVFSPDGRWIAFSRDGGLWKQPLEGAPPVLLVDSISDDFNPGIAWLAEAGILYEDRDHGLRLLDEELGTIRLLATAEEVGEVFHVRALPSGEGVVVTGCDGWCESATPRLSYVDLERDTVVALRSDVWMAWPMSDGRLVMVDSRGAVFASAFDPSDATLGAPVPLLEGVRVAPFPDVTVGADGSLLYIAGGRDRFRERIVWVDRDGRRKTEISLWPDSSRVGALSLSPDDDRLALEVITDESGQQIWLQELPDGALAPLTEGPARARRPVWSPDASSLAFVTQVLGADDQWDSWVSTLPTDASTTTRRTLLRHDEIIMEVAMTADWSVAVVRTGDAAKGEGDVVFTRLAGPAVWQGVLDSGANEYGLALSPDGRWLAHVSEVSGRPEVYVRPFPGPGPRVQVSREGAVAPRWAHSGNELFFRTLNPEDPDGDTRFMVVAEVTTADGFRVESTASLFGTAGYERGPRVPLYEVTADDQAFVMVTSVAFWDWIDGDVVYSRSWYWSDGVQAKLHGS
ncbi:MAG: hypothetical protein HKN73_15005 [Gemmatimonadetes bacterium]|nr:hypothetical protein [Gemmatimonadota bacterium]